MVPCPHCGFQNTIGRTICKSCGKSFSEPVVVVKLVARSLDERRAILAREIAQHTAAGWRLTTQTDTTASFTQQGSANPLITILLLLVMILPGILYAVLARPTHTLFIEIDEYGRSIRTQG